MNIQKKIYNDSLTLFTDFYELTMGYGYWKAGMKDQRALFHHTFRKWPFHGGYAIFAGLQTAIEYLQNLHFTENDLNYLSNQLDAEGKPLFEEGFLRYLSEMEFSCDIYAPEEGSLIFPHEPMLKVEGPIIQAQMIESVMLNILNFQTLIATKSSRISYAAGNDEVVEFGMRRAQGFDGAISAARAAFIGGCKSSSNVLAGRIWNIPIKGTMAHSWIMAFEEEKEAFDVFAHAMPKNCIFLVDTFDTLQGIKRAIEVVQSDPKKISMMGIRLDSGDLLDLSKKARKLLDENGFSHAQIMASNELEEHIILELKKKKAPITVWGVGTNLVTSKDQPALDGVYKLSAIQDKQGHWHDRLKVSEEKGKTTLPGSLQVRRYLKDGLYHGDILYDSRNELEKEIVGINMDNEDVQTFSSDSHHDLLIPVMKNGKAIYKFPTLQKVQKKANQEKKKLDSSYKELKKARKYPVFLEESLYKKRRRLTKKGLR